jgi:hypothetical protein
VPGVGIGTEAGEVPAGGVAAEGADASEADDEDLSTGEPARDDGESDGEDGDKT